MVLTGCAHQAAAPTTLPSTSSAPLLPVDSPQIDPDSSVTFRLRAPSAQSAAVSIESRPGQTPMTKDSHGVWSATVGPLPPNVYAYGFVVDGLHVLDPANPDIQPRRALTASLFEIPAKEPQYYDYQEVPHGIVRLEYYQSKSLGRLRQMRIYTPPGYDQNTGKRYPVLYLLHGYGDNQATWCGAGRAPWIADNLIAEGQAPPMIIVMPDGHAVVPLQSGRDPKATLHNLLEFQRDLLQDIIPRVENEYRVKGDRLDRAIIGPSMGGRQALTIGLSHPELFAWVGGMSGGVADPKVTLADCLGDPQATNARLKLLWFCCGTSDPLMAGNRQLDALFTSAGIRHQFVPLAGAHGWDVWRPALKEFLGKIFQ